MKILTIGGTKFIGPYVIRELVKLGHEVMAFHRGQTIAPFDLKIDFLIGDRHNLPDYRSQIQDFAPDVVVDMIAYTQGDAQTLIDTIRGICSRVVVISSQDVYLARDIIWGLETGTIQPTPLREDSALRSRYYPYRDMDFLGLPSDYEKILVEQTYLNAPDLQTTILRLPMVYGVGDPLHRFAAYLDRMNRARDRIVLDETVAHWRSSYGYVENVAWGIALAVNHPQTQHSIFNLSEVESLSEIQRISLLAKAVGWTGQVVTVTRDRLRDSWQFPFNMKQDWVTDSNRIRAILGYQELVPLSEAIKRTANWQRSHLPDNMNQSASAIALLDEEIEDRLLK